MKYLIILLIAYSELVQAETYSCSGELSRYGRPGELEIASFVRMGKSFERIGKTDRLKFEIIHENSNDIFLAKFDKFTDQTKLYLVTISKVKKSYTETYFSVDDAMYPEKNKPIWGSCVSF
jgi:hypothetical protein